MNFDKPPQKETPSQIKERLEKEGKKLLTVEEYEKLKVEGQSKSVGENEDPYKAENIIKQSKLDREKEAEIKQELEESFEKVKENQKNGFESPDKLRLKKFEEMTFAEQEAYKEEQKNMGVRPSRLP